MASWGLAYEYGKNAYEDMWRKQEENDRYAAQRKLFDLKLKAEEAEQEIANMELARSLNVRDTINAYQNDLMSGGSKGRQAFVDALNQIGVGAQLVDGTKVVFLGADGKPDASNVIDMSDTSKWTGPAMLSELTKRVGTAVAESNKYQEKVEKDRQFNEAVRQFNEKNKLDWDKAVLSSNTTLGAARLYMAGKQAGASGGSGSSGSGAGGKGASSPFNSDVEKYAEEAAVKAIFGPGVEAVKGDDGATVYIDTTKEDRPQITPTEGQLTDLYNLKNQIAVDANNAWQADGTNAAAAARVLGSQKGNARTAGLAAIDQGLASIIAGSETPAPITMSYGVDAIVRSPVRWSPATGYTGGNYTNSDLLARGVNNLASSLNFQF